VLKGIAVELKNHAPYTLLGALSGIVLMAALLLSQVPPEKLKPVFESFHAVHILLSAIVTTALYRRYRDNVWGAILVGFTGAIGVATLSDIVFPHHGGVMLLAITDAGHTMHKIHISFIEKWWIISPVALLGVSFGLARPRTKLPHAGHVLLSTWASLFYLVSHAEMGISWMPRMPLVLVVLFIAVWLPCCVSDIAWPMVLVGKDPDEIAQEGH